MSFLLLAEESGLDVREKGEREGQANMPRLHGELLDEGDGER